MPCRQGLSTQCRIHICLHVCLPTAPVLPLEGCTSISHRSVSSYIGRHRRTGTWQSDGLLSPLLPAPQEAPLSGGIGWYDVPTLEPEGRRRGLKAFPPL